jgi:hypothetical protein
MDLEKAAYHKRHRELVQDSIVNFKCATTSNIDSYTWTFRNTVCDVISIITTTVPIKDGVLKELRTHNKELKRLFFYALYLASLIDRVLDKLDFYLCNKSDDFKEFHYSVVVRLKSLHHVMSKVDHLKELSTLNNFTSC